MRFDPAGMRIQAVPRRATDGLALPGNRIDPPCRYWGRVGAQLPDRLLAFIDGRQSRRRGKEILDRAPCLSGGVSDRQGVIGQLNQIGVDFGNGALRETFDDSAGLRVVAQRVMETADQRPLSIDSTGMICIQKGAGLSNVDCRLVHHGVSRTVGQSFW